MGNNGLRQHYETASKTGVLSLSDNKLREIPSEVIALSGVLRNLNLSKNRLTCLTNNISKFSLLKQLNVEHNKLEALPDTISYLKKLDMINASHNLLRALPETFGHLTQLKQVYLNNNLITKFPLEVLGLKCLEVLELSNNKITEIPNGMASLYVAELNLSQNEIASIGDDLHQAPKLKILKLEENCLSLDKISPSLLRDSKIHTINLEGNLFESKKLALLEGYNEYTERYTAMKKKMF